MKYISQVFFIIGLAFCLFSCAEPLIHEVPDAGEVPVQISFIMADKAVQTKSKVSGEEKRVHTIQMVCFDANGLYLGIRDAESVTPSTTVDVGTIKGTVPQGTARIHFIANRNLTIPLSHTLYTQEEVVMNSEELSTLYSDNTIGTGENAHQEVCYWGYHKEATESAMQSWLNPTTAGSSKVYLIRDRARIVLTYDPTGTTTNPVTKIEWLIHGGRERGYLAPAKANWSNTGYYANSTEEGHTNELISTAKINEYTDCNRYSLWTSETVNDEGKFDETYNTTDGNKKVAQFLFDDNNEEIDGLKAILRVTYSVNGSPKTVYHVLKLNKTEKVVDDQGVQSEVKVLYDIVRTNTYYINAKLLNPDVAYYTTLKDAINGNEFMNADMEVDRSITEINDNQHTLQILLPTETTTIVFNTTGEQTMDFAFRMANDVSTPGSTNPDDFEIKWEKDQSFCDDDLELAYDAVTMQFTITANVTTVSDQLQGEWIVVKHKTTGLTRYIHVYVINQFKYLGDPTLKSAGTHTVGNTTYNSYVLNFKIPPTESDNPNDPIYPVGLYPIDVKFTTNTLNAYNTSQTGTNYGLFGIAVEGTQKLTVQDNFETGYGGDATSLPTHPISSTAAAARTHWYYQQENNWWDFWFTYSIKSYDQTSDGEVNIYFNDVKSHLQYATVTDVGLFMEIKYFGKIYSIPVTTP